MGDHNALLNSAKQSISEAIELDNKGEYEKAYSKYQRALEQFIVALRYEKNPASKQVLERKVTEYMDRAEMLKKAIKEGTNKRKAAVETSGGSTSSSENDKLRGALEGAIITEKPDVKWSDVAGLEAAKEALKEAVILPARFPQLFTGKRRPWKGILLYGPPGTGKSYLAKAVATEADSVFFAVSSADLVSKWQGESERLVRSLFSMARESAPAIIFIDEVDSLCGTRGEGENESSRRIKTEFLVQMQGVGHKHDGILVLGATNLPWALDPAMRRRFEKRIYIPLPEAHARTIIFKLNVGDTPNELSEYDYKKLGEQSDGFSGSDVAVVVREALMLPLRECQSAKFFREDANGFYFPVTEYPPCPFCPMKLSNEPCPVSKVCNMFQ
mmetsp:Transcript_28769/g.35350  ORF Transcript_28769/g.35350 Transcript_28769/m.35350 type:complete len:386 (+) Transcript_28769:1080-2237(+)